MGSFRISVEDRPLRITVVSAVTRRTLLEPTPDGLVEVGRGIGKVSSRFGSFRFRDRVLERWRFEEVREVSARDGELDLTVGLSGEDREDNSDPGGWIRFRMAGRGILRLEYGSTRAGANRSWIRGASPESESFFGLGEQMNRVRHRGISIPMWVAEPGIGRHDGPVRFPFTGRTTDSSFPVPFVLSTEGYGLAREGSTWARFHLGADPRPEAWIVESWEGRGSLLLLDGPGPREVLARWTRHNGLPRRLPGWAFGVWAGVQGGPGRVRELLDRLEGAGAPVDAVWVQDWVGGHASPIGYDLDYHWTPDASLYPDLAGFIAEIHARGLRFLGYFNPFIEERFPEYAEGRSRGFLVRRPDGSPHVARISLMKAAQVDLTDPDARAWLGGFLRRGMELGMDGWMADFGEWLPWDGRMADPAGGPVRHNTYPVDWARLNRDSALAVRPGGDFVVFHRSGFAGSTPVTDQVWAGDQNTSFGDDDGLPTVVKAGLSLGLSGQPYHHFDAGGYTSLVTLPRGEELFMRWVEVAALSPLLRTHEGYWRQRNVQPDSSPGVLAHFARMARLHRFLGPCLTRAAEEAATTGMPMMRHLWLEDPADPTGLAIEDQYLLGPSILVAPVMTARARQRRLYLPAGSWRHLLTGERFEGRSWIEVEAPPGTPPVFQKETGSGDALPVPLPLEVPPPR